MAFPLLLLAAFGHEISWRRNPVLKCQRSKQPPLLMFDMQIKRDFLRTHFMRQREREIERQQRTTVARTHAACAYVMVLLMQEIVEDDLCRSRAVVVTL